jgi:hypothetical protein
VEVTLFTFKNTLSFCESPVYWLADLAKLTQKQINAGEAQGRSAGAYLCIILGCNTWEVKGIGWDRSQENPQKDRRHTAPTAPTLHVESVV